MRCLNEKAHAMQHGARVPPNSPRSSGVVTESRTLHGPSLKLCTGMT
eukprot:CAMPEP_0168480798 /NCGR_PEP_ID=MMETSP0228-20121227/64180_1 /TAXON_ID=133427 /ORGANISM="Protoceratium reticulatum, Strain CCCM 535 (=CCMP 1889)" /LENGTH=46 /DNA_ID= /DNA_START= /DNA_END= /DNA_ORIENTATION=